MFSGSRGRSSERVWFDDSTGACNFSFLVAAVQNQQQVPRGCYNFATPERSGAPLFCCNYLHRRDYVFAFVGLSVSRKTQKKLYTNFDEFYWRSGSCDQQQMIRFWWWSDADPENLKGIFLPLWDRTNFTNFADNPRSSRWILMHFLSLATSCSVLVLIRIPIHIDDFSGIVTTAAEDQL